MGGIGGIGLEVKELDYSIPHESVLKRLARYAGKRPSPMTEITEYVGRYNRGLTDYFDTPYGSRVFYFAADRAGRKLLNFAAERQIAAAMFSAVQGKTAIEQGRYESQGTVAKNLHNVFRFDGGRMRENCWAAYTPHKISTGRFALPAETFEISLSGELADFSAQEFIGRFKDNPVHRVQDAVVRSITGQNRRVVGFDIASLHEAAERAIYDIADKKARRAVAANIRPAPFLKEIEVPFDVAEFGVEFDRWNLGAFIMIGVTCERDKVEDIIALRGKPMWGKIFWQIDLNETKGYMPAAGQWPQGYYDRVLGMSARMERVIDHLFASKVKHDFVPPDFGKTGEKLPETAPFILGPLGAIETQSAKSSLFSLPQIAASGLRLMMPAIPMPAIL